MPGHADPAAVQTLATQQPPSLHVVAAQHSSPGFPQPVQ
jgi:hypothetical protein